MAAADPSDAGRDTPSRLRNFILVAVPLVLVFGAVGFTYRFYTEHRQRYFTERYVRALAALAEQTEAAVDGLDSAFGGAVHEWDKRAQQIDARAAAFHDTLCPLDPERRHGNGARHAFASASDPLRCMADAPRSSPDGPVVAPFRRAPVDCSLNDFLKPQLELVPLQLSETLPPSGGDGAAGQSPGVLARANLLRFQQTTSATRRAPSSADQPPVDTADATLYFCRRTPQSVSAIAALGQCGWPANSPSVCAEKALTDLLDPLVIGTPLENLDIFVVDEKGTTLYERGNSGLRLAALKKDAQPPERGKDGAPPPAVGLPSLDEVVGSTGVRSITVGETTYALFSQPIRLKARDSAQYATWAVGVLVPQTSLDSDARRMPIAVMASAPLACLFALLALPILRVLTVGPREAFSSSTVYAVACSLIVATALATLAALVWYAEGRVHQHVDTELRLYAHQLQTSFRNELQRAHAALEAFRDRRLQQLGGVSPQDADSYVICDHVLDDNKGACQSSKSAAPKPGDFKDIFGAYPAFDMVILAGRDGMQREKWAIGNTNTPVINVKEFNAFRDVMRGRTLPLPSDDPDSPLPCPADGSPRRYALNVSVSPNTGKLVPLLSLPIFDDSSSTRWNRQPDGVAMMVPHLLSLDDPILPPDVGFAVIESSGRVVFHSNTRRRLYENFFAESGGDLALRSAVFASRAAFYDVDYHGSPQRLFAVPVRDTPWSLLVFREEDPLRTAHLEALTTALLCFLAVLLSCIVWLVLLRALLGRQLRAALWPDGRATARYGLLIVTLLVLALWFGSTLAARDGVAGMLITFTTPLLALTVVVVVLAIGQTSMRRWLIAGALLGVLTAVEVFVSIELHGVAGAAPWAIMGGLVVAAIVSWAPSWLPKPTSSRVVAAYAGLAVVVLINVAVLPMTALYRDAFDLSAESMGRVRQLKLAETMARHRQGLRERARTISNGAALVKFQLESHWNDSGVIAFRKAARETGMNRVDRPSDLPVATAVTSALRAGDPQFCRESTIARGISCAGTPAGARLLTDPCTLFARHFTGALISALPVLNQDELELRHAVYRSASDCSWRTRTHDVLVNRQRFVGRVNSMLSTTAGSGVSPEDLERMRMVARMRGSPLRAWAVPLAWPSTASGRIALPLLALCVLTGLWWALAALTRRMFCLDTWEPLALDDVDAVPTTGTFYLRPRAAAVEHVARQTRQAGGVVIDLLELAQPADLAASIPKPLGGPILVTHFERGSDDAQWNQQKLAVLEDLLLRRRELLIRTGWRVDIVSEIDPLAPAGGAVRTASASPAAPTARSDEVTRWAAVLERVDKQRSDLPQPPLPPRPGDEETLRDECRWTTRLRSIGAAIRADARWTALSRSALIRHIGDLAEAYYRALWSALSEDERLLLYHLAEDGFANVKNRELAHRLMRRGLVRRAPALQVMNDSFRQFARRAEDRATIRSWERASGTSTWGWLRNGVMVVAVGGGVFLFLTQPDAYAKWVGLLAALGTVGGGVTQVFGLFSGARRPAAA